MCIGRKIETNNNYYFNFTFLLIVKRRGELKCNCYNIGTDVCKNMNKYQFHL